MYKHPTAEQEKVLQTADELEKAILAFMNSGVVPDNHRSTVARTHLETAFMFLRKSITKEDNEL